MFRRVSNVFVVSYVTFLRRTRAAVVIQKNMRMWATKRRYQQRRSAAVAIQSFLRARLARKQYRQVTHRHSVVPGESVRFKKVSLGICFLR